jgi:enoyl-CoA hydratase
VKVTSEVVGRTLVVTIDRPEVRNAVDAETAGLLVEAFEGFDANEDLNVAILTGAQGDFCAGADLGAIAAGEGNHLSDSGPGPMGPTRMLLSKPVIAAVEGYAVAGGLELALWCDLRVASRDSTFGVFCRRLGVPLIDLGTVRLPRLVGHGRALDLILTGRGVGADEAKAIGLVDRISEQGAALDDALRLAETLSALPQTCLRSDRLSAYEQWSLPFDEALRNEFERGLEVIASGETIGGATRFAKGEGRHGRKTGERD